VQKPEQQARKRERRGGRTNSAFESPWDWCMGIELLIGETASVGGNYAVFFAMRQYKRARGLIPHLR
jgi:hypothetical protein